MTGKGGGKRWEGGGGWRGGLACKGVRDTPKSYLKNTLYI